MQKVCCRADVSLVVSRVMRKFVFWSLVEIYYRGALRNIVF